MYGYIYKIQNLVNGKVYIGQTTQDPHVRYLHHFGSLRNKTHSNNHLQNSFNKYGENGFKFGILIWANSREELNHLEIHFMDQYDALNSEKGYNLRQGGRDGKLALETRQKMSRAMKGRIFSEEHKQKLRENHARLSGKDHPCYGKKLSKEHREKIRNSKIGPKNPMYGKCGPLNHMYGKKGPLSPHYGRKRSLETCKRISEAKMGKCNGVKGENHPFYGKPRLESSRQKMIESKRGLGLFGFTGANLEKRQNPENTPWKPKLRYKGHQISIGGFPDPLSCEILHDLFHEFIHDDIVKKQGGDDC
jgi:group I intron endonuclease